MEAVVGIAVVVTAVAAVADMVQVVVVVAAVAAMVVAAEEAVVAVAVLDSAAMTWTSTLASQVGIKPKGSLSRRNSTTKPTTSPLAMPHFSTIFFV